MGDTSSRERSQKKDSDETENNPRTPSLAESENELDSTGHTTTDDISFASGKASKSGSTAPIQRSVTAERGYIKYNPGPNQQALSARYGIDFVKNGQAQTIQRLEKEFGSDRVSGWVNEGMTVETMGKPRDMTAFRERQAERPEAVSRDIERRNEASLQRNTSRDRKKRPAGDAGVPDAVRKVVSTPGRSLDETVQREMEGKMGDNFGDIRIHTGPQAAAATEAINARAFTVGNHVAFNEGEYDPGSSEGKRLLAHELTHVRQQTEGAVSMLPKADAKLAIDPDPTLEREAEMTAQEVVKERRTVTRMGTEIHVQPKLEVSSPSDPAEREAEQIAEQVVQMESSPELASEIEERAQRESKSVVIRSESANLSEGGGEVSEEPESEVRSGVQGGENPFPAQKLVESRELQPKSKISRLIMGKLDDKYEREADRVTEEVLSRPVSVETPTKKDNSLSQYDPKISSLLVQRQAKSDDTTNVPSGVELTMQVKYRGDATLAVNQFKTSVQASAEGWKIAARRVGSAYAQAVERHKTAIKKQERQDALVESAIFGVFSAATAGGLTWLSSAVRAKAALSGPQKLLYDSSESAVQALAGEGIGLSKELNEGRGEIDAKIPLVYQNELENNISDLLQKNLYRFEELFDELRTTDLDKFTESTDQEILTEMYQWKAEANKFTGDEELMPDDWMVDELERGLWAAWGRKNLRWRESHTSPRTHVTKSWWEWWGGGYKLEDRFDALGITKRSGVEDFGYVTTDEEVKKLYGYLSNYRVRTLQGWGGGSGGSF